MDMAAKLVVISFEDIPEHSKLTKTIEKQAENAPFRHVHQQSYRSTILARHRSTLGNTPPPHGGPSMETKDIACTSLSRHLTNSASQFGMQPFVQGSRTNTVGTALHSCIRKSPKDGITILKCVCGLLYNGKLAYKY